MAEILIVEDDLKLRTEIQKHLESGGHGVACCADGQEGLQTLKDVGCDVMILDIRLPGLSGIDVLKQIHDSLPSHPPIIIITGHGDKQNAIQAVHFGAFDFLEKPFTPENLDQSVSRALQEKKQDVLNFRSYVSTAQSGDLTARESEVAVLAAEGLSNEEIAARLSLGAETVKSHLKKIFRKLGVTNRTALAAKIRK